MIAPREPFPTERKNPPQAASTPNAAQTGSINRFVLIFGIFMVLVAGSGFLMKLIEFTTIFFSDEPLKFAFLPVMTYLMVAAGFACLFIWAYVKGQFKDIEGPKYRMLQMQDEIDRTGQLKS